MRPCVCGLRKLATDAVCLSLFSLGGAGARAGEVARRVVGGGGGGGKFSSGSDIRGGGERREM